MDAARIDEVVGDFVQLKRVGSNLKGFSPFNNERTPSFYVSPAKGIFKDFSSGKGGNAVTFLMELESMSYPEALRYLAKKYAIEIEEAELTPEQREEVSLREALALVNKWAAEYFEKALWESDEGKQIGLSYFRERGFSNATIKKFALGYSFTANDALLKAAAAAGHKQEYLLAVGLVKQGERGLYDFFRDRVMFPIRNSSGKCIAFAGRALRSDVPAKYVNSPETELYEKSKNLYGLFEARQAITREDRCLLVEGYTDVISLHQAGVGYAVASAGTALTVEQVKLIKRYTQNVSILYDGDKAGINAALRAIDLLLAEGMNVKVVLFPDGHDPDSYARSVSQEQLETYLATAAQDFTDFMAAVLVPQGSDDPLLKAKASRRMVESLALIPDHIARSLYATRAAKKMGVAEQAMILELNKLIRKQALRRSGIDPETITEEPAHSPPQKTLDNGFDQSHYEKELARVLVLYGNRNIELEAENDEGEPIQIQVPLGELLIHELLSDDIEIKAPEYAHIIRTFREHFENHRSFPDEKQLFTHSEPALAEAVAGLIASPYELSMNWAEKHHIYTDTEDQDLKRTMTDPLMRIKLARIKERMHQVNEALQSTQDDVASMALLREKHQLDEIKREVSAYFGSAII
jgi:DNA primase